jgi:hypothetical protein
MAMENLNLPSYDYKLKKSGTNTFIFDEVRQKYVFLSPEEWVRQHFAHFLMAYLQYPRPLLSLERGTSVNTLAKRTDLVVYGRAGNPLMLVECKAASIPVSTATLNQALIYNRSIGAPYLVLTNGRAHFCWELANHLSEAVPLPTIPSYGALKQRRGDEIF